MTRRRTLARAGAVVTASFLVARILGWVRVVLMGTIFGAQGELDAFFAAFRIPDLIFQLVAAGAIASALIPAIAAYLANDEERRAWRVVSIITTFMMIVLLVLSVLFWVFAPVIMPAITPGFDAEQSAQTIELSRTMLLSPIFLALGAVATAVLNSVGRFGASALAPIMYSVGIIISTVVLAPVLGIGALAVGVVLGSALHLLVQLRPLLGTGFRYHLTLDLSDPGASRALRLLAPRAVGMGVTQITFVVMTTLASGLTEGSISAFAFAFTILQIPLGVIGIPLGAILLPTLSRSFASGSTSEYLHLLGRALRLLVFVMLPIAALGIVLRVQVVTLLLDYGRFDAEAVALTASTLFVFLLGLPAHCLIAVVARAYYATQDTRTPVLAAILAVGVNVATGVVLVGPLGLAGLAFAIAIGAWIELLLLLAILHRRMPGLDVTGIARTGAFSLGAAATAGLIAFLVVAAFGAVFTGATGKIGDAAESVLATLGGCAIYAGAGLLLRMPELPLLAGVARDILPGRRA